VTPLRAAEAPACSSAIPTQKAHGARGALGLVPEPVVELGDGGDY